MKLLLLLSTLLCAQDADPPKGHLVVVGGGGTPEEVVAKMLELAGGADARIVILPQASGRDDAGRSSVEMFRRAGAKNIAIVSLDDAGAAVAAVRKAGLVWMPGGSQLRLMEALKDTGVPEAIAQRHKAGAVIGGTSAGAAVMSKVMLSGDGVYEGLGLWPGAIVDQHFLARKRYNRLLTAVLDRPKLVGVGIDEQTAVVVNGGTFRVLGRSRVLVLDARKATVEKDGPTAASNVATHVLRAGMGFDWKRGVLAK